MGLIIAAILCGMGALCLSPNKVWKVAIKVTFSLAGLLFVYMAMRGVK